MSENPYADFGTIITEDRFVGRERELRAVASRIFGERGFGSIAVVGLPRIGKTSLVSEAIRRAEARPIGRRLVVVRSNVGEPGSVGELFRTLIEELAEEVRCRGLGNALVSGQMAEVLGSPAIDFVRVRAVFRALYRADIRPVWVLDEFDAGRRLFEATPQFFQWLRELCSNPQFKAAVVIVAKRRLQDVARLAGLDSDYWANVLKTLALKPLSDAEIEDFFSRLEANGVRLGEAERAEVLAVCGGHPYLLDAFGYHAWEHAEQGEAVSVEWVEKECATLAREYFEQVSTVLSDGAMLSKAVQVLVGPQWDVAVQDVDALREFGVLLSDGEDGLRGFSRSFGDHLRVVERGIDLWPLWRETEQALREYLDQRLTNKFGPDWPEGLGMARPGYGERIAHWQRERDKERRRFGDRAESSLLAYTYPMQLYELMGVDWTELGQPLLGADRAGWNGKFGVLAQVRTPVAHNRVVEDGIRTQAMGICREILDLYRELDVQP
ncbi:MAG: ATP-binding protein [Chromatiales bacterium]|nr:ATP-binding protein [Chromatiales bacterium]